MNKQPQYYYSNYLCC